MKNREEELKERLFRSGLPELTDSELLEMLFLFANPAENSRKLAETLILKFNSLKKIMNASTMELAAIEGIDSDLIKLLRVEAQIVSRCGEVAGLEADMLIGGREIGRFLLSRFSGMKEEKVLLIFSNKQGVILGEELLGAGTVDQVVLFPRQIMERALEFNATSLIIAHNHLHGPPLPSVKDREEAERLKQILSPFQIILQDSIVVAQNRCFSIFGNTPL
jgi:DNA repair protein RadC